MADISKCANDKCPLRMNCYRFTVKPSAYQYYVQCQPKDGKCELFWLNKKIKDETRRR